MRENSQAGAFPPWRGRDAYPVRFPSDIDRFYATLWGQPTTKTRRRDHEGTKKYWIVAANAAEPRRKVQVVGWVDTSRCTKWIDAASIAERPKVAKAQVVGVGPHDKLMKEI
jgi:hypothetical protein